MSAPPMWAVVMAAGFGYFAAFVTGGLVLVGAL